MYKHINLKMNGSIDIILSCWIRPWHCMFIIRRWMLNHDNLMALFSLFFGFTFVPKSPLVSQFWEFAIHGALGDNNSRAW